MTSEATENQTAEQPSQGMKKFTSKKKKKSAVKTLGAKISTEGNGAKTRKAPTHTISLKSFDAQSLWTGRPASNGKYPIEGCIDFSRKVKDISNLARSENDPYALMKLIEVDRAYKTLDTFLSETLKELKELLADDDDTGLNFVSPYLSPFKAVQHDIYFASGYGYNGVRLLGKYDTIVVLAITAANCAAMPRRDQIEIMNTCKRKLRAFYELTRIFHHSGTTCEDFKSGNPKAKEAIEKYGAIPDDIILGNIKPKLVFESSVKTTLKKPS